MKYAIRKIYTVEDGYHAALSTTPGDVYTFDSTKIYDDNSGYYYYNPPGILVAEVNGHLDYFDGPTFVIVSFDESDVASYAFDPLATFVTKCTVVASGQTFDAATLSNYFDFTQLTSFSAYMWATVFQIYDTVIDYVTEPSIMSSWVKYIRASDHDRFAPFIVTQDLIYFWATELDDSTFFTQITDQQLLFSYCQYFSDRTELVKPKITDPKWVAIWNMTYPDDLIVDITPTPPPVVTPEPTPDIPMAVVPDEPAEM